MRLNSLTDPFYLAHRSLSSTMIRMSNGVSGLVLDVGCGNAPYKSLFPGATYIGVEMKARSEHGSGKNGADVIYDGTRLPFFDGVFDHVICNQVLEHVFEPRQFLSEINRVLRPGGSLLITVPFVWDEHEQPYDFARYSSYGLRHLAEACGFEMVDSAKTLADGSLFAQLWLAYWFKVIRRNNRAQAIGKVVLAGISVLTNLVGIVSATLLPKNPDLYLDNAMMLKKKGGG